MKKFLSAFCAGTLGMAIAFTSAIPVSAAPLVVTQIETGSNVEQIRDRQIRRSHGGWNHRRPGDWGGRRGWNHRGGWHHRGGWNRPGYWGGHRGYRYGRYGYRRHRDGWWYPLAAFGAGAVIGGAIASQPRAVPTYGNSHVQWCANRYRSYRAYDNTYQPYNGPRRQCYSPY
ncbi:BA14K family protein [Phyllobacterium salinisoli]|uniref:Lectin-like protein BA14k n=1 Tax=Phyllobacterium salinisoli TaxID=1899321 RepID=A0A368K4Z2_9HYPH|nr:BA14K family protein [Phyllobacterium salinisoli]RCS24291.1 BA14K family protein [Phyllobacterium salinisoli]